LGQIFLLFCNRGAGSKIKDFKIPVAWNCVSFGGKISSKKHGGKDELKVWYVGMQQKEGKLIFVGVVRVSVVKIGAWIPYLGVRHVTLIENIEVVIFAIIIYYQDFYVNLLLVSSNLILRIMFL